MAKRKRKNASRSTSDSGIAGCLWNCAKIILAIAFWPITLIYFIIKAISKSGDKQQTGSTGGYVPDISDRLKTDFQKPVNEQSLSSRSCAISTANPPQQDEMQQAGFYTPEYVFSTVDGYKDRLKNIRTRQKEMIQDKKACSFPTDFYMNGNLGEGKRVVNDWMKLMLRAFNGESDVIIDHVTFLNFESSKEKIRKSAESINAIGNRMHIAITEKYIALKLDELTLAYDYQQFKQAEKERIRQIREEEREKAKLEKELQERRAKILKDQRHVANELSSLTERLSTATPEESATIQTRIADLNEYTQKLQADLGNVELREQQARAGYVYIISNIGSFGENVYKIGMTRRLDPQDRVDELGDASVPFRFDVHAFIFSEDAVALESALHHAFASKRVNLVNMRREFFRVTLDEIEACVKANFSETVEFTRTAAAQEYRESEAMRNAA